MSRLRKARLDWLIGWHQGGKERAQRERDHHAAQEAKWRAYYAAEFPGPFRRMTTQHPGEWADRCRIHASEGSA